MFKKSQGLLSLFLVGGGNVISTVISSIALIIFSRYLGPTEFGVFSAGFALMQIVVRLADLGINTATERIIAKKYGTKDQGVALSYMQLVLWLKLGATSTILVLGLIFSSQVAMWLGIANHEIIKLAFAISFGTIAYEYTQLLFQSTQQFSLVVKLAITQAVGKLVLGVIFMWQSILTATSALLIYGLMPFVGALALAKYLPIKSVSFPTNYAKLTKNLFLVARWTAISMFAAALADNVDTLLIQKLLGSYDAGIWGAATRIAAFASLVAWSMGSVLSVRVAKYHLKEHLDVYLKKAKWLALGGALLVLLGVPLAGLGLYLTVGPEYLVGTIPLILLLISVAISTATTPYVALFYLFEKPQYYAYVGVMLAAGIAVGNWFALPVFGLLGAGYVKIAMRLLILAFTLYYVRRCYAKEYGK